MSVLERTISRPGPRPRFLSRRDVTTLLDELSRVVEQAESPADSASVTAALLAAMEKVGIHPALVHGFRVTGFLVSEDNQDVWTREELAQWQAAVESHDRLCRAAAAAAVSGRPPAPARSR
jgi:hypothetical protein